MERMGLAMTGPLPLTMSNSMPKPEGGRYRRVLERQHGVGYAWPDRRYGS